MIQCLGGGGMGPEAWGVEIRSRTKCVIPNQPPTDWEREGLEGIGGKDDPRGIFGS